MRGAVGVVSIPSHVGQRVRASVGVALGLLSAHGGIVPLRLGGQHQLHALGQLVSK